jgi:DNA repair protein RadC
MAGSASESKKTPHRSKSNLPAGKQGIPASVEDREGGLLQQGDSDRITRWPVTERPRERLLRHGAGALSEAQLLAILLRTGRRHVTAVELAMRILKQCRGLDGLGSVQSSELCRIGGIGPAKAAQLLAALELGRRVTSRPLSSGAALSSSRAVHDYFAPLVREMKQEQFWAVLLDNKHRVLRDVTISSGSLTMSVVHPREAFAPAVRQSAAAVIFVHNHPSGDPSPSAEDRQLTQRLVACGELLGIPVLDHVIIGRAAFYSFADHRQLDRA